MGASSLNNGGTATPASETKTHSARTVIITAALATMLVPLNSTMLAVALPNIIEEFDVGLATSGWLITGYLIAMASLLPVGGKIGDRFGRRRMVLLGLILFGGSSIASGLAPNLPTLLAFRIMQGVAGAMITPNTGALIRESVPENRRGMAFGILGAIIGIAAGLGPPLGGALVEGAGWRAVFFVNIIVIVPAFILGWRILPKPMRSGSLGQFDILGAFALSAILIGVVSLLIYISRGADILVIAVGIPAIAIAIIGFGWREAHHPDPVFQPKIFRNRSFAAASLGIALTNLSMYSLLIAVPLFLVGRNGSSALQTGFVLTAMTMGMIFMSVGAGRMLDKYGRKIPTMVGLVVFALGTAPLAFAGVDVPMDALVLSLVLVGVGLGLAMTGLQTTSVESVDARQIGAAAGVYSTSRYLGSILGSAIIAGLIGADKGDIDGIGTVFIVSFVAAVLAMVTGLGLRAWPQQQ
jgi:EmrB/QacA subfamily drug resistance transporter